MNKDIPLFRLTLKRQNLDFLKIIIISENIFDKTIYNEQYNTF